MRTSQITYQMNRHSMGVPQVKIPQKEHVFRWAPQARADSVSQYLEASEVNQPPPSPVSFMTTLGNKWPRSLPHKAGTVIQNRDQARRIPEQIAVIFTLP